MSKIVLLTIFASIVAACAPVDKQGEPSGASEAEAVATPVYVLRVPSRRDSAVPLARLAGRFEVHEGCLAFNMNGDLYLPALTTEGAASYDGDTVIVGEREIELGKDITPNGSALDPADFLKANERPPEPCASWPRIRI